MDPAPNHGHGQRGQRAGGRAVALNGRGVPANRAGRGGRGRGRGDAAANEDPEMVWDDRLVAPE